MMAALAGKSGDLPAASQKTIDETAPLTTRSEAGKRVMSKTSPVQRLPVRAKVERAYNIFVRGVTLYAAIPEPVASRTCHDT
jgi:hypothetical protein